jgi:predicted heme/steroid binding protein
MKGRISAWLCILLIITVFIASGCSSSSSTTPQNSVNSSNVNAAGTTSESRIFTASDLQKYNGQNGNPAYVAVEGKVYDVTNDKEWKNGRHEGVSAGQDITALMSKSPHGNKVLVGLPVVGTLK